RQVPQRLRTWSLRQGRVASLCWHRRRACELTMVERNSPRTSLTRHTHRTRHIAPDIPIAASAKTLMWPGMSTDQLGDYAVVAVDQAIYSEEAIFKAAYWFTDRFYVFLD